MGCGGCFVGGCGLFYALLMHFIVESGRRISSFFRRVYVLDIYLSLVIGGF